MFTFLVPKGTTWDAPLLGDNFVAANIPSSQVFNPRKQQHDVLSQPLLDPNNVTVSAFGSSSWAVSGAFTTHGAAMLASDMHLGLHVPNIWYRISLLWSDQDLPTTQHHVTGITLPGIPVLIAGSNGSIAWSFTNSYGDWSDLIVIEKASEKTNDYLTQTGRRAMTSAVEVIKVRGAADEKVTIQSTLWGPVIDQDYKGNSRVLRWTAHNFDATNIALYELEKAKDVSQALTIANRSGIPAQNFIVVDNQGSIAWTIAGWMPQRQESSKLTPVNWRDLHSDRQLRLALDEYPRIVNPPSGKLWTANNRIVDGAMLAKIGDGGFVLGARAKQIRDALLPLKKVDEQALLDIQLDTKALFLARWQQLILNVLTDDVQKSHPQRRTFREFVAQWGGHASIDSVGYRMVRAFRLFLAEHVFATLLQECKKADPDFNYMAYAQWEGPLWKLVTEKPMHMLDATFSTWEEQMVSVIDETIAYFEEKEGSLAGSTWGERNRLAMSHPFSAVFPLLSSLLDMPQESLPGDTDMPRVQAPQFGASERMIVAPGFEGEGIFHMPGGQSGHFLSPHYRDGHEAWVEGKATPFLPGAPVYEQRLEPIPMAF